MYGNVETEEDVFPPEPTWKGLRAEEDSHKGERCGKGERKKSRLKWHNAITRNAGKRKLAVIL